MQGLGQHVVEDAKLELQPVLAQDCADLVRDLVDPRVVVGAFVRRVALAGWVAVWHGPFLAGEGTGGAAVGSELSEDKLAPVLSNRQLVVTEKGASTEERDWQGLLRRGHHQGLQ